MITENKNSLPRAKRINILVVGLGGGGTMLVSHISQKLKKAHFVIADTDAASLEKGKSKNLKTFLFGEEVTQGLGTGRNPHLAQKAAQTAKSRIDRLFKGVDLVVFVACLGGGVGSGALPIFLQAAQNAKAITLGIFILPFKFEGVKKEKIAKQAVEESLSYLNAYLIIPNEKIFNLVQGGTFQEAFTLINTHIINWLESIINIIRQPSLINIDFSDLKTILSGSEKKLFLNRVQARGEHRLEKVQKEIMKNPLNSFSLERVKKILFYVRGGADLKMAEVEAISQKIKDLNPAAKIIFGLDKEKKFKEKIEVTLLALMSEAEKVKEKVKKKPQQKKKTKIRQKKLKKRRVSKVKRRNALEIRKENQKVELEKTPQEKMWEIPAFLRRK